MSYALQVIRNISLSTFLSTVPRSRFPVAEGGGDYENLVFHLSTKPENFERQKNRLSCDTFKVPCSFRNFQENSGNLLLSANHHYKKVPSEFQEISKKFNSPNLFFCPGIHGFWYCGTRFPEFEKRANFPKICETYWIII